MEFFIVGEGKMWNSILKVLEEKAAAGASIQEACAAATDAAKAGSDSTIDLIAKKGRASYLGERSIGHRDAGSYGIYVFAKAVAAYVAE